MATYKYDSLSPDNYLLGDGSIPVALNDNSVVLAVSSGDASQSVSLAGFEKIAVIYELDGTNVDVSFLNLIGNQTATATINIVQDAEASSGYALEIVGACKLVFGTRISYVPTMLKKITVKAKTSAVTAHTLSASVVAYKNGTVIDRSGDPSLTDFIKIAIEDNVMTTSYATHVGYVKGADDNFVEPAPFPDSPSGLPTGTDEIALILESTGGTFRIDVIELAEVENSIRDIPDGLMAFDISENGKITPVEKLTIKPIWDSIVVEGTLTTGTLPAQAIAFGVSHAAFDTAYDNLNTYLNTTITVFASMTTTTDITRATWDGFWLAYYNARTELIKDIETANKARIDTRPRTAIKLNRSTFGGGAVNGNAYIHGLTVDLVEQDIDGRILFTESGASTIVTIPIAASPITGILNKRSYLIFDGANTITPAFYDFNQNGYFTITIASESVGAGSNTTDIVLGASASAVDDTYNGQVLKLTYASGVIEYKAITDYTGATKTAIVAAVATAPTAADDYEVFNEVTTKMVIGWVDRAAGELTDGLIYDRATTLTEGKTTQLTDTMKYLAEATDSATFETRATFLGIKSVFQNLASYNAFIVNLYANDATITGAIHSTGVTEYGDTTVGWWMGEDTNDSDIPKMQIGDITGNHIKWDGAELSGNVAYDEWDLVIQSDTDLALLTLYQDAWVTATAYVIGNEVKNDGLAYICITGHTSGDTDDEPGTGATWATYWELITYSRVLVTQGTWNTDTTINLQKYNVKVLRGVSESGSIINFETNALSTGNSVINCWSGTLEVSNLTITTSVTTHATDAYVVGGFNGGNLSVSNITIHTFNNKCVGVRFARYAINVTISDIFTGFYSVDRSTTSCYVNDAAIGYYDCDNINNCEARVCSSSGFFSCERVSNCYAIVNTGIGFESCDNISSSRAMSNTLDGFASCDNVTGCISRSNGDDGFDACINVTGCLAQTNTDDGFKSCSEVSGCKALDNTGIGFISCYYISGSYSFSNDSGGISTCNYISSTVSSGNTTFEWTSCTNVDYDSTNCDQRVVGEKTIIDIGDWDMDANASTTVAHGLTLAKIRSVTGMIRDDAGTTQYGITPSPGASTSTIYVSSIDGTNVNITRGSTYDTTDFNATSYNRGWLVIEYVL